MKYDEKMAAKDISLWLVGLGLLLVSFSSWAGNSNVLTAGYVHTCGIKTDSTIACWGSDSSGRSTAPSGTFTQISAGLSHTCGLRTGGTISCWGSNSSGQSSQPPGTYLQVTAGGSHTCALEKR
ncbi:Regulator of chromosome condensation, RCC1 [Beggiatoa sp. PS]|nr:Regulator of chromosome condensation, RCC1 [Beggiatoa sp. PS]